MFRITLQAAQVSEPRVALDDMPIGNLVELSASLFVALAGLTVAAKDMALSVGGVRRSPHLF